LGEISVRSDLGSDDPFLYDPCRAA
jgi:hypothetical protein